jgi:hypothetical protein
MPNNATLTVRCATKGHNLAEVIFEQGKPFAYVRESATYITKDPDRQGTPKTFIVRHDLLESEGETVIVACRCGRRTLSLTSVLHQVQNGGRGKTLTDSATF